MGVLGRLYRYLFAPPEIDILESFDREIIEIGPGVTLVRKKSYGPMEPLRVPYEFGRAVGKAMNTRR